MDNKPAVAGVMTGVVMDEKGREGIGIALGSNMVMLSPRYAEILADQIINLLYDIGYLKEEGTVPVHVVPAKTRH